MPALNMELRHVEQSERLIVGVVVPYDETSYLVPDPSGERIRRNAFARSIDHRGARIPLLVGHSQARRYGTSRRFIDEPNGLVGEFVVNAGEPGDELLSQARDGYYPSLSAGFRVIHATRGADGVREVTEAALEECSLLGFAAYDGAGLLAVRSAQNLDDLLAPFRARPDVNLDPIPPLAYRRR
jgi:HK97 family phage prohead protease